MEDAGKSQRAIIFFLWKEGACANEIVRRLFNMFGEKAVSQSGYSNDRFYRSIDRCFSNFLLIALSIGRSNNMINDRSNGNLARDRSNDRSFFQ